MFLGIQKYYKLDDCYLEDAWSRRCTHELISYAELGFIRRERDDILLHNLFECTKWHSERSAWLSNIEHDFKSLKLPDPLMNTTILNILKQSTRFPIERFCSKNIIHLVAFGGHTISKKFGKLVVTRREKKRLKVSTVVSYHTACFLHCIYKKMCNTECYQTHNALSGSAQCRSSPPG